MTIVACASGYLNNGSCYPALVSEFKGRPCTSDDECNAYNYKGEIVQYGECQCGYNGGNFKYGFYLEKCIRKTFTVCPKKQENFF